MEAAALDELLGRAHVRPGVRVSESRIFHAAVMLIALHIVDDEFLQPPPGTSIQDNLRAGLLPLAKPPSSVGSRLRAHPGPARSPAPVHRTRAELLRDLATPPALGTRAH